MNEAKLEAAVMELFQHEEYEYVQGDFILREAGEVLLKDDLKAYLLSRYASDEISEAEVESIIVALQRAPHEPLYESNRDMLNRIIEGFVFRREDKSKKDLFIRLIDFDTPQNNIFKVVNQFEI